MKILARFTNNAAIKHMASGERNAPDDSDVKTQRQILKNCLNRLALRLKY